MTSVIQDHGIGSSNRGLSGALPDLIRGSAAYHSLSLAARAVLDEFRRRFDGTNNGGIDLLTRDAADAIGTRSLTEGHEALVELIDRGFVRRTIAMVTPRRLTFASDRWALTEHSMNGEPPTNDFLHWPRSREVA